MNQLHGFLKADDDGPLAPDRTQENTAPQVGHFKNESGKPIIVGIRPEHVTVDERPGSVH